MRESKGFKIRKHQRGGYEVDLSTKAVDGMAKFISIEDTKEEAEKIGADFLHLLESAKRILKRSFPTASHAKFTIANNPNSHCEISEAFDLSKPESLKDLNCLACIRGMLLLAVKGSKSSEAIEALEYFKEWGNFSLAWHLRRESIAGDLMGTKRKPSTRGFIKASEKLLKASEDRQAIREDDQIWQSDDHVLVPADRPDLVIGARLQQALKQDQGLASAVTFVDSMDTRFREWERIDEERALNKMRG
tara:strand:- start:127 stop:870 length:744 start_codon:yes stop_codon:yes gene_type:complete